MKSNLNHSLLSDKEFTSQFRNCTLNPEIFSHEAHIRLAWILINEMGVEDAVKTVQEQLLNFVTSVGETDKYNMTLTIVSVRAINHFMQKSRTNTFENFILENPKLITNFKELINSHYSHDIFKSVKAKSIYVEPDLHPIY